jgi:acyl-homoserine lactone acylase PvdQ
MTVRQVTLPVKVEDRIEERKLTFRETMRSTGNSRLTDDGRCVFSGGQVVTTVVELTDPIRVRSIVPYGQSRKPGSPHYTDQMRLYSVGKMRPAWHTWNQLRHHVESVDIVEYLPKAPRSAAE